MRMLWVLVLERTQKKQMIWILQLCKLSVAPSALQFTGAHARARAALPCSVLAFTMPEVLVGAASTRRGAGTHPPAVDLEHNAPPGAEVTNTHQHCLPGLAIYAKGVPAAALTGLECTRPASSTRHRMAHVLQFTQMPLAQRRPRAHLALTQLPPVPALTNHAATISTRPFTSALLKRIEAKDERKERKEIGKNGDPHHTRPPGKAAPPTSREATRKGSAGGIAGRLRCWGQHRSSPSVPTGQDRPC